eukprot:scaffold143_cov260-Pinguiococcus_pyrenoidosus.AAC.23
MSFTRPSTRSETYIKDRVCDPSPWTVIGSLDIACLMIELIRRPVARWKETCEGTFLLLSRYHAVGDVVVSSAPSSKRILGPYVLKMRATRTSTSFWVWYAYINVSATRLPTGTKSAIRGSKLILAGVVGLILTLFVARADAQRVHKSPVVLRLRVRPTIPVDIRSRSQENLERSRSWSSLLFGELAPAMPMKFR